MEITKAMDDYHQKNSNDFINGAMEVCRNEGKHTGDLIMLLHAQAQMCQTLVFCFMATHLREECVAGFYGEMRELSLDAVDRMVDRPELLLEYARQVPGGETPALLSVVELLKELKDSERSPTVD